MAGETASSGSKSDNLDRANQDLLSDPNANDKYDGSEKYCPLEKKKRYHHVGLRVAVCQYGIDRRKLSLKLPVVAHGEAKGMESLHDLTTSGFAPSQSSDNPPSPKKLYPIGDPDSPVYVQADMTCATQLILESPAPGYHQGSQQGALNEFLGKALAIHLFRTGTFKATTSWTSSIYDDSRRVLVTGPLATEKMGIKVFAYLFADIGGKMGIYEIKNGTLGGEVTEAEYKKRKYIATNQFTDGDAGAMPLIPGVYQVHVLLDGTSEGSFGLKEIYCDGDRIFPED